VSPRAQLVTDVSVLHKEMQHIISVAHLLRYRAQNIVCFSFIGANSDFIVYNDSQVRS